MATMIIRLRVWRQPGPNAPGKLVDYAAEDVSPDMSFLELLDVVPATLPADPRLRMGRIELRALLMTVKRCRKQNTQLTLHSVSPQIVDLFGMSGLSAFLPMYATREAALAAISDDTLEN
jgi:hypothetical protein